MIRRNDGDPNLVPSLLDRLLDEEPGVSREPAPNRSQSLRQLKQSVSRDLEALLNTRRETLDDLAADFVEVRRSLINYGLPDFTSFSLVSESDRTRIRRALEESIAAFEPRLTRVRVSLEPPDDHDRALRFRVDALLRMEPAPEPVTFDAMLQLETQQYMVKGAD